MKKWRKKEKDTLKQINKQNQTNSKWIMEWGERERQRNEINKNALKSFSSHPSVGQIKQVLKF